MPKAPPNLWRMAPSAQDEAWGLYVTALASSDQPLGGAVPGWRLLFVVRGGATLATGGRRRVRLEAGDVVLATPGAGHRFVPDPARGCRVHQVDFGGWQMARWLEAGFFAPLPRVLRPGFDEGLLGLVARLVELARSRPPEGPRLMAGALGHLLARLELATRAVPAGPRARLVEEAQRRLWESGGENRGLAGLVEELGVSATWLRRCFRAQTGMAPQQFRMRQRLERACELLSDTEAPVRAIAADLGFSSPAYFSRAFRRATGLAPSVWRARTPRP